MQGGKYKIQKCGSFASVVKEEGQRRGGTVLIGRWARVMVCKCLVSLLIRLRLIML